MNNSLEAYARHARRVQWLMLGLETALERQKERAKNVDHPSPVWPMVGNLEHVEEELKSLLMFLSGKTEAEIDRALDNIGRRGDE